MSASARRRRKSKGLQTRRWTENPHQTVPAELAAALLALRGPRGGRFGAGLAACRDTGWGVPALAAALGMTCAAVGQQISRARRASAPPPHGLVIPRPPLTAEEHPAIGGGQHPQLPALAVAHLRELHAQSRLVRPFMRPDHPYRVAAAHLAEDVAALIQPGRYRKCRIRDALGVSYRAVDQLLEQHGHRDPAPSRRGRIGYVLPARSAA